MTTFSGQSFATRFGKMGDAAEGAFEATYEQKWERWGLDRAKINLRNVPAFVRFAPDHLTAKGFVECQGFGRDQTIKVKNAKLEAQLLWHEFFRCDWFLWDSHHKRYGWVRIHELRDALHDIGVAGSFDEGRNPFLSLKADEVPLVGAWVPHTTED